MSKDRTVRCSEKTVRANKEQVEYARNCPSDKSYTSLHGRLHAQNTSARVPTKIMKYPAHVMPFSSLALLSSSIKHSAIHDGTGSAVRSRTHARCACFAPSTFLRAAFNRL